MLSRACVDSVLTPMLRIAPDITVLGSGDQPDDAVIIAPQELDVDVVRVITSSYGIIRRTPQL
jgi:hypothetical protein